MIFSMLDSLDDVDVAGLLMPTGRHDLPRFSADQREPLALGAGVLHWMARNWADMDYPRVFGRSLRRLIELRQALRVRHELMPVPDAGRSGAVWRVLFSRTLAPELRARLMRRRFFATDLSVLRIIDRANALSGLRPKMLAADGFDAVLFSMPRPVRLPPGVRQLVRFHDAVPQTDGDTLSNWRIALLYQRLVRKCVDDSVFVCNSPASLVDLDRVDPRRTDRAAVIPCALAPLRTSAAAMPASAIATTRCVGPRRGTVPGARALAAAAALGDGPYLLSVGTLEPRKNYRSLIGAWERVVQRTAPRLRLVVVANPGWQEESTRDAMRPHIASGGLVHLENLTPDELAAMMRQAACFVFPSFNEGFGYPPLEALAAGTPVIVSDLPVFRWIFGSAALYADPYDPEQLATAIERMLCQPESAALRADLLSHRSQTVERFQPATIGTQWADLLDRVRSDGEKRRRPRPVRQAEPAAAVEPALA
jgi:glycosyltransferase involved in cell wall biosynthesis